VTLRQRCGRFPVTLRENEMLRQGSPVDDLMAFVVAETGRTADLKLEEALPLCLYFADDADREGFIADVREAKPNMIMKKLP
jgi:hypothetical protein